MTIVKLSERPQWVPALLTWIRTEWPERVTPEDAPLIARLLAANESDKFPTTLVMVESEKPVAFISLIKYQVKNWEHLTHWVDALIVAPTHRGNGLASELLAFAAARANLLGIRELHAYTDKLTLYGKQGWAPLPEYTPDASGLFILRKLCRTPQN